MIEEYSVVRAKRDLSDAVHQGCRGAVLMIYHEPTLGYEIEFIDNDGNTLDVLTTYPDDIESST